jgi:hypothetical protein
MLSAMPSRRQCSAIQVSPRRPSSTIRRIGATIDEGPIRRPRRGGEAERFSDDVRDLTEQARDRGLKAFH